MKLYDNIKDVVLDYQDAPKEGNQTFYESLVRVIASVSDRHSEEEVTFIKYPLYSERIKTSFLANTAEMILVKTTETEYANKSFGQLNQNRVDVFDFKGKRHMRIMHNCHALTPHLENNPLSQGFLRRLPLTNDALRLRENKLSHQNDMRYFQVLEALQNNSYRPQRARRPQGGFSFTIL